MKALELLYRYRDIDFGCDTTHLPFYKEFDEAISELEELMKPKSCKGCVYDGNYWLSYCEECIRRGIHDRYEPKEVLRIRH